MEANARDKRMSELFLAMVVRVFNDQDAFMIMRMVEDVRESNSDIIAFVEEAISRYNDKRGQPK